MNIEAAKEIHRLVYGATTSNIPNFGGNHGFSLSPASNLEELLRASSSFVGLVQSDNSPTHDQIETLRAECLVAAATGLLGASDIEKINQLLDEMEDE